MVHELKDLHLEEVSAVDDPANKGSRVVLLKRDEKGGIMDHDERAGLINRLAKYLGVKVPDMGDENEGEPDMPDGAVEKKLQELTKKVERLEQEKATAEAVSKARDAIAKADAAEAVDKAVNAVEDEGARKGLEDQAKARKADIEKATADKAQKEFREKLSPAMQKAFDDMDEDERRRFMEGKTTKADDDPVAKALEKATKSNEALAKKVEKLEADAEIRKLRDELKDLEGFAKVDELAETYAKLRKAEPEAAAAVLEQLRALAKQAREGGLFRVIGKDGPGDDSAEARIDKAVRKYREDHPDADEATAMTKVLEAQPELYTGYNAEKEAG